MHPLGLIVLKTAIIVILLAVSTAANARLLFQHFAGGSVITLPFIADPTGVVLSDPTGTLLGEP